jgi:hypothetical protein
MYKKVLKTIDIKNDLYKSITKKSNSVLNKQLHFIFSVENPRFQKKFNLTHDQAIEMLQNKGYHAESIKDKYGDEKNSIIVHNPPKHSIKYFQQFAKDMGQESSITSENGFHEMHFHHGENANRHLKGEGTQFHKEAPADYYRSLEDGTHFSHHFDFDNFHKANKSKFQNNKEEPIKKSERFKKYPNILKNQSKHPLHNPESSMKLIHYSPQKQDYINPKYHGVSKIGTEAKQGQPDHPISFYYLEGVEPESIVTTGSKYKHIVSLGNKKVYDIGTDPDKLGQKAHNTAMEEANNRQVNRGIVRPDEFKKHYHKAIKDAGYHGIFNSSLPTDTMSHVVGLFTTEQPDSVHELHQNDYKETSAYDHHEHDNKVKQAADMDGATNPDFLVNLSHNMKK